jgi:hypothetical protein
MQVIGEVDGGMRAGTVVATVHGIVPLSRYCTIYDVIGLPPSSKGVCHVKDTDLKPGSADNPIGEVGTPNVFAVTMPLYGPGPTAFTALTLKSYNVPGCNPVTTYEGEIERDAGTEMVFHKPGGGPLVRYSTRYDVIGMPPLYDGGSHVRDTICNPD